MLALDLVLQHANAQMTIQRSKLRHTWRLLIEIANAQNAKISFVLILHMCALISDIATFPNAARAIDDKVISNISPSLASMTITNQLDARRA